MTACCQAMPTPASSGSRARPSAAGSGQPVTDRQQHRRHGQHRAGQPVPVTGWRPPGPIPPGRPPGCCRLAGDHRHGETATPSVPTVRPLAWPPERAAHPAEALPRAQVTRPRAARSGAQPAPPAGGGGHQHQQHQQTHRRTRSAAAASPSSRRTPSSPLIRDWTATASRDAGQATPTARRPPTVAGRDAAPATLTPPPGYARPTRSPRLMVRSASLTPARPADGRRSRRRVAAPASPTGGTSRSPGSCRSWSASRSTGCTRRRPGTAPRAAGRPR